MKRIAFEKPDGSVVIRTFAVGKGKTEDDIKASLKRSGYDENTAYLEDPDIPPKTDADGVSCRACFRISGGTLVVDNTVRNINREIYDEEQKIEAILNKPNPNPGDFIALENAKRKIKGLQRDRQ